MGYYDSFPYPEDDPGNYDPETDWGRDDVSGPEHTGVEERYHDTGRWYNVPDPEPSDNDQYVGVEGWVPW